jgi:hypothetical protein
MKVIHKFPLPDPKVSHYMPKDAKVLTVHEQSGYPCMWVQMDGSQPQIERKFVFIGTGWPLEETAEYLGTAHCNGFVWHVFEVQP